MFTCVFELNVRLKHYIFYLNVDLDNRLQDFELGVKP